MMMNRNFVFDTNVIVSAFLNQDSKEFEAFKYAKENGEIVISNEVFEEYRDVLFRKKFDKYLSGNKRANILNIVYREFKFITPTQSITACRDPKDNKFLELAVAANAACIITGDADLIELHPFRNIPILNAVDFLNYEL